MVSDRSIARRRRGCRSNRAGKYGRDASAALDTQALHPTILARRRASQQVYDNPDFFAVGARAFLVRDRARVAWGCRISDEAIPSALMEPRPTRRATSGAKWGKPGGAGSSVARPARPRGVDCRRSLLHPTLPLFLLFLQEIISGRHRLRRRNPGVPAARPSEEQRAGPL
jgi:hypothetical protein